MLRRFSLAIAVLTVIAAGCSTTRTEPPKQVLTGQSPERNRLFNDNWRFFLGDNPAAQAAEFEDIDWRHVDLPHDWSIEGAFDQKFASATAYLPAGIAWYRKSFTLPDQDRSKQIAIRFDGVYKNSEVWCNGQSLGKRPSGFDSFEYDITPLLHWDGTPNVIAVRVDHSDYADSRWYTGSGIYRNVFLVVTSPVHVGAWGTYVTTPRVSADSADVSIETTVRDDLGLGGDVTVWQFIKDGQGKVLAEAAQAATVEGNSSAVDTQTLTIGKPVLWSVDSPIMYDVQTEIRAGGQTLDVYHTPVGIRTFRFDASKGFFLNDRNLKLKGVCLHEDAGALGTAVPISVWTRRLTELRAAGCNAIRTSHNPPAPEFLNLCDRMGFLVMDEAFDEWTLGKRKWIVAWNKGTAGTDGYHTYFDQWSDKDLADMIRRDRNHPSIILWSIGNEIDYPRDPYPLNSPELPPIAARLIKDVKSLDPTRPVTAACAAIASNLFYPQLDVVGYNYQEPRYAADHAAHPERVIYGSENKQDLAPWLAVKNNPYISGQFLWTGIDYMGESRKWPDRGTADGILDFAGFRKPEFYFRQSLWTDKPMVYLNPTEAGVTCYTNCQSVELFQNGKSVGEKTLGASAVIEWQVHLADGSLNAVGKVNGVASCDFNLAKAGPAAKLVILPDVTTLPADGQDTANVEIRVTDADGNIVRSAGNVVTCAISGPAKELAIENGDMASQENGKSPSRTVYHGRAIVYVQATHQAGNVTLTVTTPGLQAATVVIGVK